MTSPIPIGSRSVNRCQNYAYLWRAVGLLSLAATTAIAAEPVRRPEEVKAAFLYNFARFVQWPDDAFSEPDSPFVFGMLRADDVAVELRKLIAGNLVRNRTIVLQTFNKPSEIGPCHVLYVGEDINPSQYLPSVKTRPTLTVSDASSFTRNGGMIQFLTDRRIRLRINVQTTKQARLTVSSQLLHVAEVEDK